MEFLPDGGHAVACESGATMTRRLRITRHDQHASTFNATPLRVDFGATRIFEKDGKLCCRSHHARATWDKVRTNVSGQWS